MKALNVQKREDEKSRVEGDTKYSYRDIDPLSGGQSEEYARQSQVGFQYTTHPRIKDIKN